MVDESHATGFFGPTGRGHPSFAGSSTAATLGKALGGSSGGFVVGPSVVAQALCNLAQPYLFSNTAPQQSLVPPFAYST